MVRTLFFLCMIWTAVAWASSASQEFQQNVRTEEIRNSCRRLPQFDIWAGREHAFDFVAEQGWKIESDNGRLLVKGDGAGQVKVFFPALTGAVTGKLIVDGKPVAQITAHPEKLLEGVAGECRCHRMELEKLGVTVIRPGIDKADCLFAEHQVTAEDLAAYAVIVVFTDRYDFPKTLADDWTEITLGTHKKNGPLSVIMEKGHHVVDDRVGGIAWVKGRLESGQCVIWLPPEFDLKDIDNILYLKKELTK